jgi:hypothetical protein
VNETATIDSPLSNPKGIANQSPGLHVPRNPGTARLVVINPSGVVALSRSEDDVTPLGVGAAPHLDPQGWHNPAWAE